MYMQRQSAGSQALLAMYLDHKGAAASMPTVYMEAATWGWGWVSLLHAGQGLWWLTCRSRHKHTVWASLCGWTGITQAQGRVLAMFFRRIPIWGRLIACTACILPTPPERLQLSAVCPGQRAPELTHDLACGGAVRVPLPCLRAALHAA